MYRPLDHDALWSRLRRRLLAGPTPAGELYELLGVSAATLSRLLAARRGEVRSSGRGRAVQHALRRAVAGDHVEIPLYEVSPDGTTTHLGTLHPIEPAGFVLDGGSPLDGVYPGLPWFLLDLLPAGFLGRLLPARHPELAFPQDIRDWSIDQSLVYLTSHGHDVVGNFILGGRSFASFLTLGPPNPVALADRPTRYPALAADVLAAGVAGSSAGGEQPKFLATREDGASVLVKFSPPVDGAYGARVADLLVCEHLAVQTVERHGIRAAHSEIHRFQGRTFLEVHRFDRTPSGGRRGLVSLRALDAELVGEGQSWTRVGEALHAQGRISAEMLREIVWLDRFGDWIDNTDRHLGNLSFRFEAGRLGGLSPVYDMLPMRHAPRSGEVPDLPPTTRTFTPTHTATWLDSWRAALEFWRAASEHALISEPFRMLAARTLDSLLAQERTLRKLPDVSHASAPESRRGARR